MTLMMEDLLHSTTSTAESEHTTRAPSEINFAAESTHSFSALAKPSSNDNQIQYLKSNRVNSESRSSINEGSYLSPSNKKQGLQLIGNYNKWRFFLLTWKRLEMLKIEWTRRKLFFEHINTSDIYAKFSEIYKKDILLPVLKILIKNPEVREMYENVVDFKQPILLPPDVSELDSKIKQIQRLVEKIEISMIDDTVQRVQKETKLVLAERNREESTLSTDLWKRSIMKEEFTINKPHIANDFTRQLFVFFKSDEASASSDEKKKEVVYSIREEDLKGCLVRLGNMIQEREKSNFEQYAMFYENLLRQQHQLLYTREREVKSMKQTVESKIAEINVEVQCQMADVVYDLIMGTFLSFLKGAQSELILGKLKFRIEF